MNRRKKMVIPVRYQCSHQLSFLLYAQPDQMSEEKRSKKSSERASERTSNEHDGKDDEIRISQHLHYMCI